MLKRANKLCERLWKDDSGVVLALTVVVFLSLFMMAVSVFAVGENIRQRITLQNAADAAAYSGAIVQADALSRIAILNQALSWEYAQLCKMQMDYIIGKWADGLVIWYKITAWAAYIEAIAYCPILSKMWIGEYPGAGKFSAYEPPTESNLKEKGRIASIGDWQPIVPRWKYTMLWAGSFEKILDARDWYDDNADDLRDKMDESREEVDKLSKYEDWIQENLKTRITESVEYVLRANLAGDATSDLYWALSIGDAKEKSGGSELEPSMTTEKDQDKFFSLSGIEDNDDNWANKPNLRPIINSTWYFGPGWKTWYDLKSDGDVTQGHEYKTWRLVATWFAGFIDHGHQWIGPVRICTFSSDTPIPTAIMVYPAEGLFGENKDDYFQSGCNPRARVLTADYFRRSGAVSVGVSRKMRNPLALSLDDDASKGIFSMFDVGGMWSIIPGRGRKSWAVAIGRAGYKNDDGDYDPHATADWVANNREKDKGNLSVRDWDALLIPIRRAWVLSTGGSGWEGNKDCTAEVMKAFANGDADADWQGLFPLSLGATSPGSESGRLGWGDSSFAERWGTSDSITWDPGDESGEDSPKTQMERAVLH